MGINGVSSYANTYTYGNVKNENVKPSKNSEKNYYAGYTMNSANKFKNVSDYSKYLTNISVEFKFTNNGTEMTTCGIFGETGTDSEIDKWLERMKEDKEKEDKKTENMIAKVGFDTYA